MTDRAQNTDRQQTVCLIGNAPTAIDRSAMIDASDIVIRCNDAFGLGGVNGARTTHCVLINCGGQMREWLGDPGFTDRPQVRAADVILLPIHPGKDDLIDPPLSQAERVDPAGRNYGFEAKAMLEGVGKTAVLMPVALFQSACAIIGYQQVERSMKAPSSGLLALLWALDRYKTRIDVVGFGFAGWDGHRWDAERAFFERMERDGRIRIHPPR